jgi:DNA-binding NtrC family response regulator
MNQRLQNTSERSESELVSVLVVDDEPIIRDLLRAMLRKMKVEVDIAENGVEAQKKILANSYDLVITDINMPEMDGLALLKWIKKRKPAMETVVMTGYDITEEMLETIGKSAMEFFRKPPDPKKIRIAIQHCRERLHP